MTRKGIAEGVVDFYAYESTRDVYISKPLKRRHINIPEKHVFIDRYEKSSDKTTGRKCTIG